MVEFAPIRSERVYEKVVAQVQSLILDGQLKRGDRLPSERHMVDQLGISRASLREAYSALELIGLIETRPRDGTFIKEEAGSSLHPLALFFLADDNFEEDFLELRRLLELQVAGLAAQKMDAQAAASLHSCVQRMAETIDDRMSIELDKEFHRRLAKGSGNRMLVSLLDAIAHVVDHHIEANRVHWFQQPEHRRRLVDIHTHVADAVAAADSEGARRWMEEHFGLVDEMRRLHQEVKV